MCTKYCDRIDEQRGHVKLEKSKTINTRMEKKAYAVLPVRKSEDGYYPQVILPEINDSVICS